MCVVALLPWWMGLPLWLLLMAGAVAFHHRIDHYAELCRLGLRWWLPGVLFATQRALGGNALAWGIALLGALVGYTVLALVESLLDHGTRHGTAAPPSPEWRDMALAPIGPTAHIIELARAQWCDAQTGITDPDGQTVRYEARNTRSGRYVLHDGTIIDKAGPRYCFGPAGHWFVATLPGGRGQLLWDRRTGRIHRLAGWVLSGWEGEQPWLARSADGVPAPLHEVLGHGRR